MNRRITKLLLAGEYICRYRYPAEFESLQHQQEHDEIDAWLGALERRIARLGSDGAFFMAPVLITVDDQRQLKAAFLQFRDVYGPAVLMLDMIRQTDSLNITLTPGEFIPLYELEQAVANSSTLEMQLKNKLQVIDNASHRNTVRENLRRMMEHLVKDGYLVLASKETGTYRVTGKIDQLYAVLAYLSANTVITEVDASEGDTADADLVDLAQGERESL